MQLSRRAIWALLLTVSLVAAEGQTNGQPQEGDLLEQFDKGPGIGNASPDDFDAVINNAKASIIEGVVVNKKEGDSIAKHVGDGGKSEPRGEANDKTIKAQPDGKSGLKEEPHGKASEAQPDKKPDVVSNPEQGQDLYIKEAKEGTAIKEAKKDTAEEHWREVDVKLQPAKVEAAAAPTNGKADVKDFDAQFGDMPGLSTQFSAKEDLQTNVQEGKTPEPQKAIKPAEQKEAPKKQSLIHAVLEKLGHIHELASNKANKAGKDASSHEPKAKAPEASPWYAVAPKEGPVIELPDYNGDLPEPHIFGKVADLEMQDVDTNLQESKNPELKAVKPEVKIATPKVEVATPKVEVATPKVEADPWYAVVPKEEPTVELPSHNGDLPESHIFGKAADLEMQDVNTNLQESENPELKAVKPEAKVVTPKVEVATPKVEVATPKVEAATLKAKADPWYAVAPKEEPTVELPDYNGDLREPHIFGKAADLEMQDVDTDLQQSENPELKAVKPKMEASTKAEAAPRPDEAKVVPPKDNELVGEGHHDEQEEDLAEIQKSSPAGDDLITEDAQADAPELADKQVGKAKEDKKEEKEEKAPIKPKMPDQADFEEQFEGMPGIHQADGSYIDIAKNFGKAPETFPLAHKEGAEEIPAAAKVNQMIAEAPLVTDKSQEDALGDRDPANLLRLTGLTTLTQTTSGTTSTSIATVTFDPTHTKFLSCIYGCSTLIVNGPAVGNFVAHQTTSTITVLPVTLPCSLLICPPCGCTSKAIFATGCPVITTITPPSSFVTVTADFTVTFITTTVTVTDCTATTCLIPSTFTLTTTGLGPTSTTTLTQTSTSTVSVTTITTTSTTVITRGSTTARVVTPDDACPCGYDYTSTSSKAKRDRDPCGCKPTTSIIPPDCPCQQQEESSDCGCGSSSNDSSSDDSSDSSDSSDDGSHYKYGFYNFKAIKGAADKNKKAKGGVKRSAELPATRTITGEVCTTFVVCNPRQFSCPGQITDGSALPTFMSEWGLLPHQVPEMASPLEISQPTGSYIGFDGKTHGLGSGMVANSSNIHQQPHQHHQHIDGVKGVKIVKDAQVVFGAQTTRVDGDSEPGSLGAAKKNDASRAHRYGLSVAAAAAMMAAVGILL